MLSRLSVFSPNSCGRFSSCAQWNLSTHPIHVYSFQAEFQGDYKSPTPLQIDEQVPSTEEQNPKSGEHPAPRTQKSSQSASTSQGMKRLSLQLSASLHREAKLAALEDEETLNSMVIGLLKQYLAHRRKMIQGNRNDSLK